MRAFISIELVFGPHRQAPRPVYGPKGSLPFGPYERVTLEACFNLAVRSRIDAVAQLAVRTAPLTMRSWDVLGKRWYYVGMVTISGTLLPGAFLLSMTAV